MFYYIMVHGVVREDVELFHLQIAPQIEDWFKMCLKDGKLSLQQLSESAE